MRFDEFQAKMTEILQRHRVNVLNISVRHAHQDPGSMLAWAREEVFAFVLYYKQQTGKPEKNKVGIWTRELIDAALATGGTYYLPYQLHATPQQFHQAYPRAKEFFALKKKLDPDYKFRNKLWDKYYARDHAMNTSKMTDTSSEFRAVFQDKQWRDRFFLFLQNVYNIYPENEFHLLIREACTKHATDKEIYEYVQQNVKKIKPFLAEVRYAIPALIKQKKEMASQTMLLVDPATVINGYLEMGSTGRYISQLRKYYQINAPIYLLNDKAPSNSPVDILERGGLKKTGTFINLDDYNSISPSQVKDASLDLVTCYVGLHHVPLDKLDNFIDSLGRILRPGGKLIVRDHDVDSPAMRVFVSLVHTVFNAGLGVSWKENCQELRHFTSVRELTDHLEARGFKSSGKGFLQDCDPSNNTLMEFVKV
jgi:SAM-dependent methyltransferase